MPIDPVNDQIARSQKDTALLARIVDLERAVDAARRTPREPWPFTRVGAFGVTTQTIPHNDATNLELQPPGVSDVDIGGQFDPATPDRLIARRDGSYLVYAFIIWVARAGGIRELAIRQTGDGTLGADTKEAAGAALYQHVTLPARLLAGESVQFRAFQNSGTPLDHASSGLVPYAALAWVGP